MNKLDMQSINIVDGNIEKISELFPNVIVESANGKAIDFELLKQELSKELVEGTKERYQLTWPGKKEAIVNANTPSKNTLRPIKDKSIDFDNTKNVYIEGDNLEVLKILQDSYLNKIKCIYIDPPYNTGNDFIYNDKFNKSENEELVESGQIDESGNRMVTNNQSNGKFHSDWLSMMYSRLKLARTLLSKNGVIFISIGDDEVANLEKICDEIFGQNSKLGIIVQEKGNAQNDAINIQNNHDYILVYQKEKQIINGKEQSILYEKVKNTIEVFKEDDKFYYIGSGITTGGEGGTLNHRPNLGYTIYYNPKTGDKIAVDDYNKELAKSSNDEEKIYTDDEQLIFKGYEKIRAPKKGNLLGVWTWSKDKFNLEKDLILIKKTSQGYSVRKKEFVDYNSVYQKGSQYFIDIIKNKNIRSVWNYNSASGTSALNELLGNRTFDNPKNLEMIEYILEIANLKNNDIILDFFSGSATTAHALLNVNLKNNINARFVMVQLPELCDEKSENFKRGFRTICDIGEERIRKVSYKMKEDSCVEMDTGFRVYSVDSSNMKDVFYKPNDLEQSQLRLFESNIKEDRTTDDLLTQVILDLGLTLDLDIEERMIGNNNVYYVAGNSLVACFDDNIDINIVDKICECEPYKVVFKDSAFKFDNDKINLEERFKKLLPQRASDEGFINIL